MFAEAVPGDSIGINVTDICVRELRRGFVVSDVENDPAQETASFIAQVRHCRFIFFLYFVYLFSLDFRS